jgi:rubrerythrin
LALCLHSFRQTFFSRQDEIQFNRSQRSEPDDQARIDFAASNQREHNKEHLIMIATIEGILSLLLPAAVVAGVKRTTGETTTTLDNLQVAFHGKSNAHHRYVAVAKKADDEGYREVASLFRAAARAEQIHASNHGAVIRKLGAVPKATIETPAVASTRENLQVAIVGEMYERDQMYPALIREAKASKNSEAIRTFTYALKTEAEHFRLYSEALKNLDEMHGKSRTYFVCGVCGYMTENLNFLRCLVCGVTKDRYTAIS